MNQPSIQPNLLVLQIAMLAHEVNRAYCEAIGDPVPEQWDKCSPQIQQSAINGVNFWLGNPAAPPEAAHNSWMAARVADGWRLGEKKDENQKTHPNIRPFEALHRDQQVKDSLFRGVVRAVTYSHNVGPKIAAQTELVQQGIVNMFGEFNEETAAKWNALSEDERKAACDAIVNKSRELMAIAEANGLTPEQWNELTEEQREALIAARAHLAVGELGDQFFAKAVLTKPGESVLEAVQQMQDQHEEAKMALPTVKLAAYEGAPEVFDLTPTVQLSRDVMVAAAQQSVDYSEEEWNMLDPDHRHELIDAKFLVMKSEAETSGLV